MLGNVWEWVQDWYADYPATPVTDPTGPASGRNRVARGGSWSARDFGPATRAEGAPSLRQPFIGLRIARTDEG